MEEDDLFRSRDGKKTKKESDRPGKGRFKVALTGIGHDDAVAMGNTRKKPWRISRTPTLNSALPLAWFVQHLGLLLLG